MPKWVEREVEEEYKIIQGMQKKTPEKDRSSVDAKSIISKPKSRKVGMPSSIDKLLALDEEI